jgi:Tfp pilus assembly protein PilX/cytoskeletal protein CcmA (bactofilin family)
LLDEVGCEYKKGANSLENSPNTFRNEQGYVLVLVLVMVVFISIVGVMISKTVIQSNQLIQVSENGLKAEVAAENKLNELEVKLKLFIDELNRSINPNNQNIAQISAKIRAALASFQKDNPGVTVEIVPLSDERSGTYSDQITMRASVIVGKREKQIQKVFTISTIAEVFRYAAISGDNLELNGAVLIDGDAVASKNLIVSNRAEYPLLMMRFFSTTTYPSILGNLFVGSGKYYYKNNFGIFGNDSWRGNFNWKENNYWRINGSLLGYDLHEFPSERMNDYFVQAPLLRTGAQPQITSIAVGDLIDAKSLKLSAQFPKNNHSNKTITSNLPPQSVLSIGGELLIKAGKTLEVQGNLLAGSLDMEPGSKLIVKGDIHIAGQANLTGEIMMDPGKYIYIGQSASISNMLFNGEMYINKSLRVSGEFNTNGTVYAKADSTIEELSNESGGTLVVMCEGNLTIMRNNDFSEPAKIVKAYFYSNQTLEIFGVISNLEIHGGVYGNPLILNAVKGKTRQTSGPNLRWEPGLFYFQNNQSNLAELPLDSSRLKIINDNEMLRNPPRGLPTNGKLAIVEIDTTIK